MFWAGMPSSHQRYTRTHLLAAGPGGVQEASGGQGGAVCRGYDMVVAAQAQAWSVKQQRGDGGDEGSGGSRGDEGSGGSRGDTEGGEGQVRVLKLVLDEVWHGWRGSREDSCWE